MGDTKIVYDEAFGINTFKIEILAELGEEFWNQLIKGMIGKTVSRLSLPVCQRINLIGFYCFKHIV